MIAIVVLGAVVTGVALASIAKRHPDAFERIANAPFDWLEKHVWPLL
jgi:hypothetical protein